MTAAALPLDSESLPVHAHDIVTASGVRATRVRIYCPARKRTVPFEACTACAHVKGTPPSPAGPGAAVTCTTSHARRAELFALAAGPDVGEAAARVRLGAAMAARLTSVHAAVSTSRAAEALACSGQQALVVLDDEDHVVGIVTRCDLAGAAPERSVAEAMRAPVHTLPEDACLAHAIALMACENVRQVPVLDEAGALVGMVTDRDVVRWLASRFGYAAPAVPWERAGGGHARHAPHALLDRVVVEHVALRQQLDAVVAAARAIRNGSRTDIEGLARELRLLSSAFRIHLAMEEAQLAPALVDAGLWNAVRVDQLRREHARQRAELVALAHDVTGHLRTAREHAEDALWLAAALTDDMAHEERELVALSAA